MRTLLMFSAVALFFTSCGDVEQFRAPVEELATKWDSTTAMITDFVNTLQNEQQRLQNQYSQINIPEGNALSEKSTQQVADLEGNFKLQLGDLTELSQEVSEFVSDWQSQAEDLTALKEGLTSGKLGAETSEKIENLESNIESAQSALEDWQTELEELKDNTSGLLAQYNTLIAKS